VCAAGVDGRVRLQPWTPHYTVRQGWSALYSVMCEQVGAPIGLGQFLVDTRSSIEWMKFYRQFTLNMAQVSNGCTGGAYTCLNRHARCRDALAVLGFRCMVSWKDLSDLYLLASCYMHPHTVVEASATMVRH
jgi:hypothetical protein